LKESAATRSAVCVAQAAANRCRPAKPANERRRRAKFVLAQYAAHKKMERPAPSRTISRCTRRGPSGSAGLALLRHAAPFMKAKVWTRGAARHVAPEPQAAEPRRGAAVRQRRCRSYEARVRKSELMALGLSPRHRKVLTGRGEWADPGSWSACLDDRSGLPVICSGIWPQTGQRYRHGLSQAFQEGRGPGRAPGLERQTARP